MKKIAILLLMCMMLFVIPTFASTLDGWNIIAVDYGMNIFASTERNGQLFHIECYPLATAQEVTISKTVPLKTPPVSDKYYATVSQVYIAKRDTSKWGDWWCNTAMNIDDSVEITLTIGICNIDSTELLLTEIGVIFPDGNKHPIEIFGRTETRIDNINENPTKFVLNQNYPNPFNNSTIISYEIENEAHVGLIIVNSIGQIVAEMIDRIQPPGKYCVVFSGADLASGMYIYGLVINEKIYPPGRKMFLSK